jgi:hypothetical protein
VVALTTSSSFGMGKRFPVPSLNGSKATTHRTGIVLLERIQDKANKVPENMAAALTQMSLWLEPCSLISTTRIFAKRKDESLLLESSRRVCWFRAVEQQGRTHTGEFENQSKTCNFGEVCSRH